MHVHTLGLSLRAPRTGSRSGWPVHSPGTPRPTLPPMLHTCAHAHSRGSFPGQSTGAVGAIESHRLVQVTPVRVDFLTVKSTLQSVSEKISSADAEKIKGEKTVTVTAEGWGEGPKIGKNRLWPTTGCSLAATGGQHHYSSLPPPPPPLLLTCPAEPRSVLNKYGTSVLINTGPI